MAEQQQKAVPQEVRAGNGQTGGAPVLNPGYRPAVPAAPQDNAASDTPAGNPSAGDTPKDEQEAEQPRQDDPARTARRDLDALRETLRHCNRLLIVDDRVLQMPNWPDDRAMAMARRFRDLWMLSIVFCTLLLTAGMVSFVPAWVGGAGFGLLVVSLLFGTPPLRRIFTREPSFTQLLLRRYQLLGYARDHVRELEGGVGLAWRCRDLARYNRMLEHARYSGIRQLSQRGELVAFIQSRSHVRLYLMFIQEAQKAYHRAQAAYLEAHQKALEKGWLGPDNQAQTQE